MVTSFKSWTGWYLTELNKHADELSVYSLDWMPWNYRDPLDRKAASGNN